MYHGIGNKDALSSVVNTNASPITTPLAKNIVTGKIAEDNRPFWKAVQEAEAKLTQDLLVAVLANTQLGYLVYEHMGKKIASAEIQIHPTIVNREGKNVVNQDVILGGIIAQLQVYANHPAK